jgi:hypothetical protein
VADTNSAAGNSLPSPTPPVIVAIEDGMDRALGGNPDVAGAPARLLALEPDNQAFDLSRPRGPIPVAASPTE